MPGANQDDGNYIFAYAVSSLMEETLKQCGDNADAREPDEAGHQLQEAAACRCCCRASPSAPARPTYYPIQSVQLARFKGETWELFGDIMSAEGS